MLALLSDQFKCIFLACFQYSCNEQQVRNYNRLEVFLCVKGKNQYRNKIAFPIMINYVPSEICCRLDNLYKVKVMNNMLNNCSWTHFCTYFVHYLAIKIQNFLQNILYSCAWLSEPSRQRYLPKTKKRIGT